MTAAAHGYHRDLLVQTTIYTKLARTSGHNQLHRLHIASSSKTHPSSGRARSRFDRKIPGVNRSKSGVLLTPSSFTNAVQPIHIPKPGRTVHAARPQLRWLISRGAIAAAIHSRRKIPSDFVNGSNMALIPRRCADSSEPFRQYLRQWHTAQRYTAANGKSA